MYARFNIMGDRIYGWDQSHYDGDITLAIMETALVEGIEFVTHKLGEGPNHDDDDPKAAAALLASKNAGIQLIGGYWFCHGSDDPALEARTCVETADRVAPWWRTFPGWFFQADLETSATGLPSPAFSKSFCDALAVLSDRTVIAYASHGMYQNRLTGLGHRLWNANYGSEPTGPFEDIYPGDNSPGWDPYSGQVPVILQYSSRATIAGRTTCDANAFKGTVADFMTLIGVDMTGTPVTVEGIDYQSLIYRVEAMERQLPTVNGGIDKGKSSPFTAAVGGITAQVRANGSNISSLMSTVSSGFSSMTSGFSQVLTALSILGSKIDKIPTTTVPAAPISDADVDRIAAAAADAVLAKLNLVQKS